MGSKEATEENRVYVCMCVGVLGKGLEGHLRCDHAHEAIWGLRGVLASGP